MATTPLKPHVELIPVVFPDDIFEQLRQDAERLDKITLIGHIAGEIVSLEVIQDWVNKFLTNLEIHPEIQVNQICLLTLGYFSITFLTQEGADKALSLSPIKCEVTQEDVDKALEALEAALLTAEPTNCDVIEEDEDKAPLISPIKLGIHVMFLHSWTPNFAPPPSEPSVLWVVFPRLPRIYYPYIEYIAGAIGRVVWQSDKASNIQRGCPPKIRILVSDVRVLPGSIAIPCATGEGFFEQRVSYDGMSKQICSKCKNLSIING
jgi:hypothetical protein